MKYLVESHIGGFYITESDPEIIKKPTENGESNIIVFSYEGELIYALEKYFSNTFLSEDEIISMLNKGYSHYEIIENINYRYDLNKVMLDCLLGNKIISFDDKLKLLPVLLNSQKDNILLFNSIKSNQNNIKRKIKKITKKMHIGGEL